MIENREVMARNIQRNMERMGVNATEVCRALDIKQNTFSDWIHAKTYPRIDKIEKMARYFGVSKADLVEDQSSVKEIILSNDEKIVVETMRTDAAFKNHLVKYARMLSVNVGPGKELKKEVAALKIPKDKEV